MLLHINGKFTMGKLKSSVCLKKLARSFNATFRYIDYAFSLNNSKLSNFVDRIYRIEHAIKDITDTARYASYLDLHLEIGIDTR
jgi:hypothetical protein